MINLCMIFEWSKPQFTFKLFLFVVLLLFFLIFVPLKTELEILNNGKFRVVVYNKEKWPESRKFWIVSFVSSEIFQIERRFVFWLFKWLFIAISLALIKCLCTFHHRLPFIACSGFFNFFTPIAAVVHMCRIHTSSVCSYTWLFSVQCVTPWQVWWLRLSLNPFLVFLSLSVYGHMGASWGNY